MGPRFSLVMTTTGRVEEVRRLLESLRSQTYKAFELIVVDQSEGDEVEALCRGFSDLDITHTRAPRVGVSRARNLGIPVARGEIIAVPDDDCEYPEDLLARVAGHLDTRPEVDGVTGVCKDRGTGRLSASRFDRNGGIVTPANLWRRHVSTTIFLRRRVCDAVGHFDARLGLGAEFGSGEETDLMLRVLRAGFTVLYCPDLVVYHPDPVKRFDASATVRAYSYGVGAGAVLRKHACNRWGIRLLLAAVSLFIRPLGAGLAYSLLDRDRGRFHMAVLRGRVAGFIGYSAHPRRLRRG